MPPPDNSARDRIGSAMGGRPPARSVEHNASDDRSGYQGVVASFMNTAGLIDIDMVADAFHMSRTQLAETAGLGVSTITKVNRQTAPKAQSRVTEILEIINRVKDWAGGETQAMAWFRSQPIPALDGRTAEALVKSGRATAVREYLDHLALGGYA